jgi:hypothetical protein
LRLTHDQCDTRYLSKPEDAGTAQAIDDLNVAIEEAISEYTLGDDAKACCDMIESILSKNLMNDLQGKELSGRIPMLHPLHHICLSAYIALASAYRFRALSLEMGNLHGEKNADFFRMARSAAAYSLLLAGTTHHLFVSECSFMVPLSHFLLSAGHSMSFLVDCIKGETKKVVIEPNFTFSSIVASSSKHDPVQYYEFRPTCEASAKQMLFLSLHCWPFLVQGLPCMQKIKNPVEFRWLGAAIFQFPHLSEEDYANLSAVEPAASRKGHEYYILRLAICCITYGKYLASVCYGPQHYLADDAKDLLEGIINLTQ